MTDTGPPDPERTLGGMKNRLLELGLKGTHFEIILGEFCNGLCNAGISLLRAHVTLRAYHPEFGGIAHIWRRDTGTKSETFGHVQSPPDNWVASPFYALLASPSYELRQRLNAPNPEFSFPIFDDLRAEGGSDYIAFKVFFSDLGDSPAVDPNAPPEGMVFSITSSASDGFSEQNLVSVRNLLPAFCLALKSGANRQMASDIAKVYLGRDAGERVLSGDIVRGSTRTMRAVICYFDLSGFTKLSEALPGQEIIELLNDYFGMAVEVIQDHGGNVLKFMGDGMLAVFNTEYMDDAQRSAIEATVSLREQMVQINKRRDDKGLTSTKFTVALHVGDVLYGNIGGRTRLDFTVIGPAVNTAARLSGMCAHVDQSIIISANVARPCLAMRNDLVSLGQYRLRGVAERQELFTLD